MHTNSKTVIFIHIPKAAGSTFKEILWRQCGYRNSFNVQPGERTQPSIDKFRQLPESKKSRFRLIHGHVPFGLHRWLSRSAAYITILRKPVERVVSEYYYILRTPIHPLNSELVGKNLSLQDYIRKIADMNTTNLQTHWVSGCVDFDSVAPPYEKLPANALDLAKENIENFFSICGLIERFDESLLLMQKILGWKNVYYMRRNVRKRRASKDQLPAATLRLIEKHEEKDLALYEFAAGRLMEMLDAYGIRAEHVRRFRTINRFLGTPVGIFGVLKRKLVVKLGLDFPFRVRPQKEGSRP